jgi:hypothetical protein
MTSCSEKISEATEELSEVWSGLHTYFQTAYASAGDLKDRFIQLVTDSYDGSAGERADLLTYLQNKSPTNNWYQGSDGLESVSDSIATFGATALSNYQEYTKLTVAEVSSLKAMSPTLTTSQVLNMFREDMAELGNKVKMIGWMGVAVTLEQVTRPL